MRCGRLKMASVPITDVKRNLKKESLVLVLTMTTKQEKSEKFFAEHAILLLVTPKLGCKQILCFLLLLLVG